MAISKRLRFEILLRDGFACRYCGIRAQESPLVIDHVTPRALGGTDAIDNLVQAISAAAMLRRKFLEKFSGFFGLPSFKRERHPESANRATPARHQRRRAPSWSPRSPSGRRSTHSLVISGKTSTRDTRAPTGSQCCHANASTTAAGPNAGLRSRITSRAGWTATRSPLFPPKAR